MALGDLEDTLRGSVVWLLGHNDDWERQEILQWLAIKNLPDYFHAFLDQSLFDGGENPELYASELVKTCKELNTISGKPVHVVAHSYGGLVAAHAVREHPYASSLVLLNTPVEHDDLNVVLSYLVKIVNALPAPAAPIQLQPMQLQRELKQYAELGTMEENLAGQKISVLMVISGEDGADAASQKVCGPKARLVDSLKQNGGKVDYLLLGGANHFYNERAWLPLRPIAEGISRERILGEEEFREPVFAAIRKFLDGNTA